jgi:protease I
MAKKALLIIASQKFRDEEFLRPKKILEEGGVEVTVASSSLTTATGMLGAKVKPDILLEDVKVDDYDAVVFVGGSGASEYWNSTLAHSIAREAEEKGKLLCAICIAPVTLANAGLLRNRRATVFGSEIGKLKAKGAVYTAAGVEKDGRIITGQGPEYASEFGRAILGALRQD